MVGISFNVQKFGGGALPQKNLGPKHAKFGRFLQRPTLIASISETDQHIEKREKTRSTTTTSTLSEKNLMNFGPQTTEIQWCTLTHPTRFYRETIINSALKGRCPFKFLRVRFLTCRPVPGIFAIKVESCQKSCRNLDVFGPLKF